jgi:hypothetical protein
VEGGKRPGRSDLEHCAATGDARWPGGPVEVAVAALDQAIGRLAIEASANIGVRPAAEGMDYRLGYVRRRGRGRRRLVSRPIPRVCGDAGKNPKHGEYDNYHHGDFSR